MQEKSNLYGLETIVAYDLIIEEQLNLSRQQLFTLKQAEGELHLLEDKMIAQVINLHNSQTKEIITYLKLCHEWRKVSRGILELEIIVRIEKNAAELEAISNQIFEMLSPFTNVRPYISLV